MIAAISARFAGAEALHPAELGRAGVQQPGQSAELVEQRTGELQRRDAGPAGAQQQRNELDIRQRGRAEREQLFPRAGIGR
jgi:hypothetical protein